MASIEILMERINEEIEKLKQKDILVKINMPIDEEHKFSTYSTHELNSISYQVIYAPKNIILYEDEYYINFFLNYLINLHTKSDKILYLLENINEDAYVSLGLVDYNSYFHFTRDKVIINIDTLFEDTDTFKKLINIYDKNPKIFIRNIVKNSLTNEFNDLLRRGKMRFFNSTIFNVKVRGKKYAVFTTSNSQEKIMYILDEDNNYVDIFDERYSKILKKLSLVNSL
ncbi:MAG: hypothetical protein Q4E31_05015 [Intestinibacter bartlettii]|uniref:hypothetical protein n=1 Tax=Intestinibacter bartlettii TaxID=261299 RepID=UPI0026EDC01B|nr:hypothetical protein [Intestinibacter bartlettii]MDO5010166.1 hypothetical protein [Intestinibacter bartlettii]